VANFFTDNEDIQFYLDDSRLERITDLREREYAEHKDYPFAPEDFEDAHDNFHRVLSLVGEIAAETLAPSASDVDLVGCTLENNEVTFAKGTQETLKRLAQADLFVYAPPKIRWS
jgi:hypothetical protein